MCLKEKYQIKEIKRNLANKIQVKHHYLHKESICAQAFGLFDDDKIIGVALYGTPSSHWTAKICGVNNKKNVIELQRLWIQNDTPKNAESYFIAGTMKFIKKEIIVSFADPECQHLGVIYQALNWLFTGRSARKGGVIAVKNMDIHNHALYSQYTVQEMRDKFGADNVYYKDYLTKFRYVQFNCDKRKRRELMNSLIYEIQAYPKDINSVIDNTTYTQIKKIVKV